MPQLESCGTLKLWTRRESNSVLAQSFTQLIHMLSILLILFHQEECALMEGVVPLKSELVLKATETS